MAFLPAWDEHFALPALGHNCIMRTDTKRLRVFQESRTVGLMWSTIQIKAPFFRCLKQALLKLNVFNSYEFIFGLVIAGSSEVDNSTGARVVSFGTW